MIARQRWIDRRFTFDLDPGNYPCVIERLRGTPARLEELVFGIPGDVYEMKPEFGWSIKEAIGHMSTVEQLWNDRLDQYLERKPELVAADMSNTRTQKRNFNEQDVSELLQEFRHVRAAFVKRLEAVDDDLVAFASHHPRLNKPMRLIDMAVFVAEHDDQHLAEIVSHWRRWGGKD